MSSTISYRFKNSISTETVSFTGSVITIGDVKRLIAIKRGLGAEGAPELSLFDSSTSEPYSDDAKVIPRNSLVIVKRAPLARLAPLQATAASGGGGTEAGATANGGGNAAAAAGGGDEFGGEYYSDRPQAAVVGEDEDRALQSLLQGTASTWQREVRQGALRGRGLGRGRGAPLDYRCPRCMKRGAVGVATRSCCGHGPCLPALLALLKPCFPLGPILPSFQRCEAIGQHWVSDCPTQGDPNFDKRRVRPPVGIPMTRLARAAEGGLVLPDGQTGTLIANEDAFAREILGLPTAALASPATEEAPEEASGAADAKPALLPLPGSEAKGKPAAAAEAKPPLLLLDSKSAGEGAAPEVAPVAPAAAVPMPILPAAPPPRLAGEAELSCSAPTRLPPASLFGAWMAAGLLPRGPPDFLRHAFDREEPLQRSGASPGAWQGNLRAWCPTPEWYALGCTCLHVCTY